MVAKLKDLGVTTVVMFTDVEMGKAITAQATRLEYQPEWIIAGYQYQDLALLAAFLRPGPMGARVRHLEPVPLREARRRERAARRSTRCSGTTDEATARRARRAGRTSRG